MAETKDDVNVKYIPTNEVRSERVYINVFAITAGKLDFSIVGMDIGPDAKPDPNTGEIKMPIQVDMVVPHAVIPLLIKALKDTYKSWKDKNVTS